MEALKKTVDDLSQHFHKTMTEFQQNLQTAVPATSPSSNIAAQFSLFRNFVLSSLNSLQGQLELLSHQVDQQETRSRRKILLIHGVQEETEEVLPNTVVKVLQKHLKIPEVSAAAISRCHRMGQPGGDRSRAILVKFHELSVRNKIWFCKKNLKGSGVTLAEFLTKSRYETFMAARQQVGVSRCWTKDGQVIVLGADGKRHSVTSKFELSNFSAGNSVKRVDDPQAGPSKAAPKPQIDVPQTSRPKRFVRK